MQKVCKNASGRG